jgi:GNAT superfamily N-acetyltransferase
MFDFRPVKTEHASLLAYSELFKACFPNARHLDIPYLTWLYAENPDGLVVGFDAYDGRRLAAHYACIPTTLELFGQTSLGLLSLNTATHPDYQGKGLFTQLANRTYEAAADREFSAVYGIANANSTPGFIRKLGFTLVSPLEARLGLGAAVTINWDRALREVQFRREWNSERISWRCRNPANPATVVSINGNDLQVRALTDKPMISAWASIYGNFSGLPATRHRFAPWTLFLGLLPDEGSRFRLSFNIPMRLRPSPLNFIFKRLGAGMESVETGRIVCSFVDFDAY